MKLWLISQTVVEGYATYDSAVVAAMTEEEARHTHPSDQDHRWGYDWAKFPDQVTTKLIGTAVKGTEAGVICASFNAG